MKTLQISIGNRRGSLYVYHRCEDDADLKAAALDLAGSGESEVEQFICDNFECDEDSVEHFIIPTADCEEDGPTSVVVQDETGETVFDEEIGTAWMCGIAGNPERWSCDESVPEEIAEVIELYKANYPGIVAKLVADGDLAESDLADECVVADAINDYTAHGLCIECAPRLKKGVYAVEAFDTYGIGYEGEIILEDGEEFDPKKLSVWAWDNDWCGCDVEGIRNCIIPLVKYGDKFYMLHVEDWWVHYSSFEIVDLKWGD